MIIIRRDLNRTDKQEVYDFLIKESNEIDKSHKLLTDSGFKEYFPELYEELINSQYNSYPVFKQRLWHFFNNDHNTHTCYCGNVLGFMSLKKGYRQYCSNYCRNHDENYLKKVSANSKSMWKTNENMQKVLSKLCEGRDNWWKTLNKEQRAEHTKHACEAMTQAILDMDDEDRKRLYEQNASKSKETKRNKPQEIKDLEEEKRKKSFRETINNRTEERKSEISKNVSNGLKNMSDEQKAQRDKNKHASMVKRTQAIYPDVIDVFTVKSNHRAIYTCSCTNPDCDKCENRIYKTSFGSFRYRRKKGMETCPICLPRTIGISSGELEVLDYIKSIYSGVVLANDRTTLNGKEIDIYLPDLKLGFEFQGDLWHANPLLFDESFVNPINGRTYEEIHMMDDEKKEFAKTLGIEIIEIWETDWVEHPRKTKKIIKEIIKK